MISQRRSARALRSRPVSAQPVSRRYGSRFRANDGYGVLRA